MKSKRDAFHDRGQRLLLETQLVEKATNVVWGRHSKLLGDTKVDNILNRAQIELHSVDCYCSSTV